MLNVINLLNIINIFNWDVLLCVKDHKDTLQVDNIKIDGL